MHSKSLRSRIGLRDDDVKVLDTSQTAQHDYREHDYLHWNPLLDWFTSRTISARASPSGPIGDSKEFVTFHILLPHALRAFENQSSLIHRMWITIPPVSTLRVHFIMKNIQSWPTDWMSTGVELTQLFGITFGHLFELWADREPTLTRNMTLAVGIYVMPLCATKEAEMQVELDVSTAMHEEWMLYPRSSKNAQPSAPELLVPGLPLDVVRDYVGRTYTSWEEDWFAISKQERDEVVRGLLVKQLQKTKPQLDALLKENEHALWPALALQKARIERTGWRSPYSVEYAAGSVFNRQH